MGYKYTEKGTNREVEVTEDISGSVTVYLRNEPVATRYARDFNNSVQGMQRWAERFIAEKLDPILSREDYYQVSWHIAFGMSHRHAYTTCSEELTEQDMLNIEYGED